jgi:hypothetical protein
LESLRAFRSALANPFKIRNESERVNVNRALRRMAAGADPAEDREVTNELSRLAAKFRADERLVLLCWCAPKPCHGDVVVRVLRERVQRSE